MFTLTEAAMLYLLCSCAWADDIVFILGADQPSEPAYYAAATEYYKIKARSEKVKLVTTARSLAEVREVLQRTKSSQPWASITLVAHGTPWSGLRTNIFTDGTEATLENIERVIATGEFPELPPTKIDVKTLVRLESCGVGRRPDYIAAIAMLFVGKSRELPVMQASRNFVAFIIDHHDKSPAAKKIELPVLIRSIPGEAAGTSQERLSEILDDMRNELEQKQKGASADAIWAVSPISIQVKLRLPLSNKLTASQLAKDDGFIRNAARIHGLRLDDLSWNLGHEFDDDGRQTLTGSSSFVLMRANLDRMISMDLLGSNDSD